MKIVVFGASGKVGRLVVSNLLDSNHQVVAFVHSAEFEPVERLTVLKGDIHTKQDIADALKDYDVVISTLGSWGTPTKDILSAAMKNVIPVMEQGSSKRIITLTGSAAWAPEDVITAGNKIMHGVFGLVAKPILQDAEEHVRLLHSSSLAWTTVRAGVILNGEYSAYRLDDSLPKAWETVNRAAVAKALVDQIESQEFLRQAPHIHGSTSR